MAKYIQEIRHRICNKYNKVCARNMTNYMQEIYQGICDLLSRIPNIWLFMRRFQVSSYLKAAQHQIDLPTLSYLSEKDS